MRRDTDPWGQVDAISMILQSIDWTQIKMEATSPAGDRFLLDGKAPKRLKLHVCVTVECDPSRGESVSGAWSTGLRPVN